MFTLNLKFAAVIIILMLLDFSQVRKTFKLISEKEISEYLYFLEFVNIKKVVLEKIQ